MKQYIEEVKNGGLIFLMNFSESTFVFFYILKEIVCHTFGINHNH